jgi:carbon-monoxide dehydrogenase small subunit
MSDLVKVAININGKVYKKEIETRLLLSDFIRYHAGLTGTHVGCEHGVCGTCTILMDGQPVRSCLTLAVQAEGHEILTVESLGTPEKMHPIQEAFREKHAAQCGFCTPGILMTLSAYLRDHKNPSEDDLREAIDGNLCRCTGYENIVEAAKLAAQNMAAERG